MTCTRRRLLLSAFCMALLAVTLACSVTVDLSTPTPAATPLPTATGTPTPDDSTLAYYPSKAKFQVFILNPVHTCLAGNDFASGNVCFGEKCGDCSCEWDDFDPPAPMLGIPPEHINDAHYAGFAHRICLDVTLAPEEVEKIRRDMLFVAEKAYEWTDGTLELQMSFTELPVDYAGFVAPEFVFGPFEVDDELLNPYVGVDTDFIYTVSGVHDRKQNLNLAFACGGSYGEMSIHGASYSNIQYGEACNSVTIDGVSVYEPLIHEWYHNLDWSLYHTNLVMDIYDRFSPDWANWKHGEWPACGTGGDPLDWFPSIDFCEWDPDWIDCNNNASAGSCLHAGEVAGQMSWYEHVLREHYPRTIKYVGNYCRDGRKDVSETGVDTGWPCP
ncbi:MAG TPA: hypothetical protein PK040_04615 [Anaerolineaceae bacterium]|nr:hypothetical protein [Anaerolineaceae bacterium]